MKKLILKTALITLGSILILAVTLFGIVSFCAPAAMMRFFYSIGLENLSGDYAYQEYRNTKDIGYLVYSFEIAAAIENNAVAEDRFEELYGETGSKERAAFAEYCIRQDEGSVPGGIPHYNFRAYLCGRAACVKYRLALTDEDRDAVCEFSLSETAAEMSEESPVMVLALEAIRADDPSFCELLLSKVETSVKFNQQNEHYENLIKFLEEAK